MSKDVVLARACAARRWLRIGCVGLALLAPASAMAGAADSTAGAADSTVGASAITVGGELDVNSHYVWRGIAFSRGMVVNPSLTFARGELSLNLWANLDRDLRQQHALNEVDWTLGWSRSLLGVDVKPSAMLYTYPETGLPGTVELMIELDRTLAGPVSTFTRQSVDVKQIRGAAFSSLGVACDLPEWRHVTLAGNLQYGRGWWRFASAYASPELEGLNVTSASVSATVNVPGAFTLRPHVDWYQVANRAVRSSITGSSPFVWGIALDGEF